MSAFYDLVYAERYDLGALGAEAWHRAAPAPKAVMPAAAVARRQPAEDIDEAGVARRLLAAMPVELAGYSRLADLIRADRPESVTALRLIRGAA